MNAEVTKWAVEIYLSEVDGRTHADARLVTGVEPPLEASGHARLSDDDPADVPEIGFELAAARALRALADLLLTAADADVEALVGHQEEDRGLRTGGW